MTRIYDSYPPLAGGYAKRIFGLLFFLFAGLLIASVALGLLTHGGLTTPRLRIATVLQDLLVFILPAVLAAAMFSSRPDRLLETDRGFSLPVLLLAVLIMIVSLPAMNALVAWNESLTLPESMSGVEEWMKNSEESARRSIDILFGGHTVGDLLVSFLIVAVLAGFSEELFFRGALQRLLASGRMNPHTAVWLTAFIFSVFHIQFYGFFPRLLLGAFFGYLLYWSGSLWLPVAIHTLNNAIVVFVTWYSTVAPESNISKVDSIGAGSVESVIGSVLATALVIKLFLNVIRRERRQDEEKSSDPE